MDESFVFVLLEHGDLTRKRALALKVARLIVGCFFKEALRSHHMLFFYVQQKAQSLDSYQRLFCKSLGSHLTLRPKSLKGATDSHFPRVHSKLLKRLLNSRFVYVVEFSQISSSVWMQQDLENQKV